MASPGGTRGYTALKAQRGISIELIDLGFHALGNPSSNCRSLPGANGAPQLPAASGLGRSALDDNEDLYGLFSIALSAGS